jgi:hypothetical protein
MPEILLYQPSDEGFAERAMTALAAAGIACHRVGQGVRTLDTIKGLWTDQQVNIYVDREEDYKRANELIVKLGAAVDTPPKLPSGWLLALIIATVVAIATFVAWPR